MNDMSRVMKLIIKEAIRNETILAERPEMTFADKEKFHHGIGILNALLICIDHFERRTDDRRE